MNYRESTLRTGETAVLPEQETEGASGSLELFRTSGPDEFKIMVMNFIHQNKDSQESLERLARELRDFENQVNESHFSEEKKEGASHLMKSPEEIFAFYEKTVKPQFRKSKPYSSALYAYLQEAVKVFGAKYGKYLAEQDKLRAQAIERERQARILAHEQEQEERIKELSPEIRREMIDEMKDKPMFHQRSAEHQSEIADFEARNRSKSMHQKKDQAKVEAETKEEELLIGNFMEKSALFGEGSTVCHADKYDDYFNHCDLAVDTKHGPLMLVDLTYSQESAGQKQYYNKEHPLRALAYPSHPELAGRPGIPVVIGLTREGAQDFIADFIEDEARGRIKGERWEASRQSGEDQHLNLKEAGKWVEYVLIQLRRQHDFLWEKLSGIDDEEMLDRYEYAISEYDSAIQYFNGLKKARFSSVELDEKRVWDRKILYADQDMNSYARKAGKSINPEPVISSFSETATPLELAAG